MNVPQIMRYQLHLLARVGITVDTFLLEIVVVFVPIRVGCFCSPESLSCCQLIGIYSFCLTENQLLCIYV
jgi:hypothetical protein